MVHTHVAELTGGASTGGARPGLSVLCAGEGVPAPEPRPGDRGCRDERFVGLGMSVILGDDLRKPAYKSVRIEHKELSCAGLLYIELITLHVFEVQCH